MSKPASTMISPAPVTGLSEDTARGRRGECVMDRHCDLTWNDLRRAVRDAVGSLEDNDPGLPLSDDVCLHLSMAINALDHVAGLIKDREGKIWP